MSAANDGGVYVSGINQVCDVIGNCVVFIEKISANGTVEWTTTFTDEYCSNLYWYTSHPALSLSSNNQLFYFKGRL